MAPLNREERHLLRQRGAGPRPMENAQFSFNFGGAPLPPRKSSRKTPSDLPARPSSRKTPNQLAPRLYTQKSPAGSAKGSGTSAQDRTSASISRSVASATSNGPPQTHKTPTITGKRKRDGRSRAAVQETEPDELELNETDIVESLGQSIHQSIEVSPAKKSAAPVQIDEDDELSPEQPLLDPDPNLADTHTFVTPSLPAARGLQRPDVGRRVSLRNDGPSEPARGRSRTRKSVTATNQIFEEEIVPSDDELSPKNQTTTGTEASSRAHDSTSGLGMADGTSSLFVPLNQSTRREVFYVNEDDDELTPPQAKRRAPARAEPIEVEKAADVGASDDDELSPKPRIQTKKKPSRSSKPIQVREDTIQEAESGDELTPKPRPQPKTNPSRAPLSKTSANAPKRKAHLKPSERTRSPAAKKQKTSAKSTSGTIPITVYRRSKPQDIDDDPLGADPTPGLNPADVLAQISGELTNNYISSWTDAPQQQSQASKKTHQRQINALITFRDSMQDSLFDLTIAQNTSYILAMRVRKANKEKRKLREELMSRRREREEIELKIDQIRAVRKAKVEKETREQDLVQGLLDIESAIKRGRERAVKEGREDEGPDMGIEMLAADVFDRVGNGGILGRVRDWNGVLEETAAMIEGRV